MTRIRLFLACLVFLALPLQGALAASMRLCLPQAPAAAVSAPQQAQSLHVGHASLAAGHAGHGEHASPAHGEPMGASAATATPDSQHQCGICAACGHAAALSASPSRVVPSTLAQAHPALAPARVDTRGLPVPDKPPRA